MNCRLFVLCSIALGACAPGATMQVTDPTYLRSSRNSNQIQLFMQGRPIPAGSIDVAIIKTRCSGGWACGVTDMSKIFDALREEAARQGVDAVREIYCAPPGTVGAGLCQGIAIVFVPASAKPQ